VKRFLPAILLTAVVVLSAPFVGVIRDRLFDLFPRLALHVLAVALGGAALAAFVYAVARIRRHRWWRYGGLVAVGVLLFVQYAGFSAAEIEVALVEKLHILEYGLLAWLLYRPLLATRPGDPPNDLSLFVVPLLGVTVGGILDEWMQWQAATRMGTIEDVWLDVFAGVVGLLFSLCLEPPERFAWRLGNLRRTADFAAAALLLLGLFFYDAHLGYLIEDPEIGRFRSWHTREELIRASEERAARWALDPLYDLSPWQREDPFLTEAGWHKGHRDRTLELGHLYWAAQANRILEKYYAPYLDLEEFANEGRRWLTPEVKREIEAAPPPPDLDGAGYLSPVLHDRVYTRPSKPTFLALLAVAVVVAWGLPRIGSRGKMLE